MSTLKNILYVLIFLFMGCTNKELYQNNFGKPPIISEHQSSIEKIIISKVKNVKNIKVDECTQPIKAHQNNTTGWVSFCHVDFVDYSGSENDNRSWVIFFRTNNDNYTITPKSTKIINSTIAGSQGIKIFRNISGITNKSYLIRNYTCSNISKVEAYSLLKEGHTYLDRDNDGHPCEWNNNKNTYYKSSYPSSSYESNYVRSYYRKDGTYVRGHFRKSRGSSSYKSRSSRSTYRRR